MKGRLVATLLVVGVARAAGAQTEAPPPVAPAPVTPAPAPPPAVLVEPSPAPPPAVLVEPSPAPPPAVLVEPLPAPPTPTPSEAGPLIAGALTAFVPFVAGCALWSESDRDDLERAGTYVMAAGFAAAPWVSHGLQHRWKRGALFGAISGATAAATLVAMEAKDPFYAPYANRQRVPFGVLLSASMFAAAIGVFDSFLAAPARETP